MGPRSPKKVIPTKMGRPRVAHTPFSPEHRGGGTITTIPTNPSRDLAGSPDFLPWAAAAAWPLYVYKTLRLRKLRLSGKRLFIVVFFLCFNFLLLFMFSVSSLFFSIFSFFLSFYKYTY